MPAFRKKIYNSLDVLQADLDKRLEYYNENRPHHGKQQQSKTPVETFKSNLNYALEKTSALFSGELFTASDELPAMNCQQ